MQHCNHCKSHAYCINNVPIFANLNHEEKMEIAEIASTRSFEKAK